MSEKDTQFGTVIGADASFKGDFKFETAARVLGNIEGSITSKGVVHIASGSRCKATIAAKEVSVEGNIEGNVEATDRIELRPNGVISGDIVATKMTMADGASIDGYCRIGANGKSGGTTEVKPGANAAAGGGGGGGGAKTEGPRPEPAKAR